MAKDEETGIDPVASDGDPDWAENDLARRKQLRAAREKAEEDAVKAGRTGTPIDSHDPDEPEAEMFPLGSIQGDHKVTMKNIVPAGKSRKTEAKMGAAAIPMRDGLRGYGELLELLVTVEAGKVSEVPDLEEQDAGGRRKLLGVKDVQHFRPVHVSSAEGMFSLDQVLDIIEQHFGVPRTSDKVAEVFGLKPPVAAAQ